MTIFLIIFAALMWIILCWHFSTLYEEDSDKMYTKEEVERIALDLLANANIYKRRGKAFNADKWLEDRLK